MTNLQEMTALRIAAVQLDGIPHALTWSGRHWIPSEPLIDGAAASADIDEMAASVIFTEATDHPSEILQKLEAIAADAIRQKVSEVLQWANEEELDVVVLPEMLIPASCISVLAGYSAGKVIVAGIGQIRNQVTASRFAETTNYTGQPEDLVGKNIAVLVHDGRVEVVEKKNAATEEALAPGAGPRAFSLRIRDRIVRIAVATCIDYLHEISAILNEEPQIVCIPAYTASVAPFMPDAPRDHVRILANAAAFGGTTIVASGVAGPVFAQVGVVKPIPPRTEGLIAVNYAAPLHKPTPIHVKSNRVALRAQFVPRAGEEDPANDALRSLAELRIAPSLGSEQLKGDISRWLRHLPVESPLADSLRELRRLAIQETDDAETTRLLSAHLSISSGNSVEEIRDRQASFIIQRIGDFVAISHRIDHAGRRLDRYRGLLKRSRKVVSEQDGSARWTFAFRLGRYDSDTAADSLPRQLNLLRAISDLPAGSISVTYRIQAKPSAVREDSYAYFDVIVSGDSSELQRDEVEAQMRSIMVSSWALSGSDEREVPADAKQFINLTLAQGARLSVMREDWSSLIDLLRTHIGFMSVDLRVVRSRLEATPSESIRPEQADPADEQFLTAMAAAPYVHLLGDRSVRLAGAFHMMAQQGTTGERQNLELSVVISSADRLPALLVSAAAHELLGSVPFSIDRNGVYSHQAAGPTFRPSEVLRVFHPPYGRVQGRGVPHPEPYRTFYTGRRTLASGTKLGTALIATARYDRRVDIRIDEVSRTRHIYVVGKTGTGKTNLLKEIARQDMDEAKGLCVIDPHGDLVDYLAEMETASGAVPVLLDFGNPESVTAFNPLLIDCDEPDERTLHTADLIQVLAGRFYNQYTGPRFNDLILLAIETMFTPAFPVRPSIALIEELYLNREVRGAIIERLSGTRLAERWRSFEMIRESDKADLMSWALSKLASLMPEGGLLRLQMSADRTPLSIKHIVERNGTLLVKIPEARLGRDASAFLASLLMKRIQRAVFSRSLRLGGTVDSKQMTIVVDEFQKVADAGLESFVAEARKFNCALVMAHQNLEQLFAFSTFEGTRSRELLEAIIGNVGTVVSFRVGPQDVEPVARLLGAKDTNVRDLNGYQALCRLTVDGSETSPFNIDIDDSGRSRGLPANGVSLRKRMLDEGYWMLRTQADESERKLRSSFAAALRRDKEIHAAANQSAAREVLRTPDLLESAAEEPDWDELGLRILAMVIGRHVECSEGTAQLMARRTLTLLDSELEVSEVVGKAVDEFGAGLSPERLGRLTFAIETLAQDIEPDESLLAWGPVMVLQCGLGEAVAAADAEEVQHWLASGRAGPPPQILADSALRDWIVRFVQVASSMTPDWSTFVTMHRSTNARGDQDGRGRVEEDDGADSAAVDPGSSSVSRRQRRVSRRQGRWPPWRSK
jgi:hypothetical protein